MSEPVERMGKETFLPFFLLEHSSSAKILALCRRLVSLLAGKVGLQATLWEGLSCVQLLNIIVTTQTFFLNLTLHLIIIYIKTFVLDK